jgi:hypothetical protein
MPSNHLTEIASEELTQELLARVHEVMELRDIVGHAVTNGITLGHIWGENDAASNRERQDDEGPEKRPKLDEAER